MASASRASTPAPRQLTGEMGALPNASFSLWYERGADRQLPGNGVFAGMMDLSQVDLPDNGTYYLCGPLPFMQAVRSALIERKVPPEDIQYEVFGPDLWQADFE